MLLAKKGNGSTAVVVKEDGHIVVSITFLLIPRVESIGRLSGNAFRAFPYVNGLYVLPLVAELVVLPFAIEGGLVEASLSATSPFNSYGIDDVCGDDMRLGCVFAKHHLNVVNAAAHRPQQLLVNGGSRQLVEPEALVIGCLTCRNVRHTVEGQMLL